MRLLYILLILSIVWLPATVSAEFYKYRDANGVLRYTDNIADVPENQRPKVETHKAVEDNPSWQHNAKKKQETPKTTSEQPKTFEIPKTETGDIASAESLARIKNALDQEYEGLMKEKEDLLKTSVKLKNAAEVRAYKEQVTDLNRRIADFEQRRQEFNDQADAFNASQKQAQGK